MMLANSGNESDIEVARSVESDEPACAQKIWDSAEFKEFMYRRGFDMIYLDSAKYAEFMKADNEDNGKTLKSLGLAKK